jgi:hypothetical protein
LAAEVVLEAKEVTLELNSMIVITTILGFLSLAPVQDIDPKAFQPGLHQKVFQDDSWVSAGLDKRDISFANSAERLRKEFANRRHDLGLLDRYRSVLAAKANETTCFEEANAVICFLGLPYGFRASYVSSRQQLYFGQKEYWDLAQHWPKHPSPLQYRTRAYLYTIIGGNIRIRLRALENYLKYFPLDEDFLRMRINVKFIMDPAFEKLKPSERQELTRKAKLLFERHETTNNLLCYYGAQAALANVSGLKEDNLKAIELGTRLVKECAGNKFDQFDTPSIQRDMAERQKRVNKVRG